MPVVNDENAEVVTAQTHKENGLKSRIPIDAKKSQTVGIKKVKTKIETKSTEAPPKVTQVLAFSSKLIPEGVENIDSNDSNNVFLTPDYVNDIYVYLRHLEVG